MDSKTNELLFRYFCCKRNLDTHTLHGSNPNIFICSQCSVSPKDFCNLVSALKEDFCKVISEYKSYDDNAENVTLVLSKSKKDELYKLLDSRI